MTLEVISSNTRVGEIEHSTVNIEQASLRQVFVRTPTGQFSGRRRVTALLLRGIHLATT